MNNMVDQNPEPITLIQAINLALHYAMAEDENAVVLGEDVATNGGVFRATEGLLKQFGAARVIDTPLAESLIAGMSIGMATQGMKPIAEFQFMGFIYPAFDHIINHASRMRHRTRSRLSCPVVFRAPYGGGIQAPEHHSESTEALFAHIPGLRVITPSSPKTAYGLLLSAIDCPDPVLFLEPKRIYRSIKEVVKNDGVRMPLDKCRLVREGSDITLISWGATLVETLAAAEKLAQQGIECDVIDVLSLSPLDLIPMLNSIQKTGRGCIIHEAAKTGGLGAEICASLQEHAFQYLSAPILRITGPDIIMPYAATESIYMLSADDIQQGIMKHFKWNNYEN